MINISIKMEKDDVKRIERAFKRILNVVEREKKELPYKCAVDALNLLRRNIMTQKFAGSYAPYHPRYAYWKAQYFATTGFLVMRGSMVNSLNVFRDRSYNNRWYAGLPPSLPLVPGSSWWGPPGTGKAKSINEYAWANEFGLARPARPVFVPTKLEYEEGGFKHRIKESRNRIRKAWR